MNKIKLYLIGLLLTLVSMSTFAYILDGKMVLLFIMVAHCGLLVILSFLLAVESMTY